MLVENCLKIFPQSVNHKFLFVTLRAAPCSDKSSTIFVFSYHPLIYYFALTFYECFRLFLYSNSYLWYFWSFRMYTKKYFETFCALMIKYVAFLSKDIVIIDTFSSYSHRKNPPSSSRFFDLFVYVTIMPIILLRRYISEQWMEYFSYIFYRFILDERF